MSSNQIRLKSNQVDPKNPHSTSRPAPVSPTSDISKVSITSSKSIKTREQYESELEKEMDREYDEIFKPFSNASKWSESPDDGLEKDQEDRLADEDYKEKAFSHYLENGADVEDFYNDMDRGLV